MRADDLLALWRKSRSSDVADALDALGVNAAPIAGKVGEREKKWIALAKKAADVATLVATAWPAQWQKADARLAAIAKLDDPRIAMMLARLLEQIPWTARGALDVYRTIAARLVALADPRTVEVVRAGLAAAAKHYDADDCAAIIRKAAKDIAAAAKVAQKPLAKADREKLKRLAPPRSTARASLAELLAAVHADPDDTAARLVYADALLERGDPHGEFIALQCNRKNGRATPREKALVAKHLDAWLGPLAGSITRAGTTFERGFLHTVQTKLRADKALAPLTGKPVWQTVREVMVDTSWAIDTSLIVPFLAHPVMRNLRCVTGISEDNILELAKRAPLPWTTLRIHRVDEPAAIDRALPAVEHFDFWKIDVARPLLDLPFGDRVRSVHCSDAPATVFAYLARRKPAKLERVEVDFDVEWKLACTRTGAAWNMQLSTTKRTPYDGHLADVIESLDKLPKAMLASLTLTLPRGLDVLRAWATAKGHAVR